MIIRCELHHTGAFGIYSLRPGGLVKVYFCGSARQIGESARGKLPLLERCAHPTRRLARKCADAQQTTPLSDLVALHQQL